MRRTAIPPLAMLLVLPACAATVSPELGIARDYVFAACIIDRYPGTPLASEADLWASGLVQAGTLPANAYPRLADLGRSAPPPGETSVGEPMRLESCARIYSDAAMQDEIEARVARSRSDDSPADGT